MFILVEDSKVLNQKLSYLVHPEFLGNYKDWV